MMPTCPTHPKVTLRCPACAASLRAHFAIAVVTGFALAWLTLVGTLLVLFLLPDPALR